MKRKTKAIYSNANTLPPCHLYLPSPCFLIHLKTLLLNEESIFQMRISVMRVALSMKTFLTIVCRAQNSNNVACETIANDNEKEWEDEQEEEQEE